MAGLSYDETQDAKNEVTKLVIITLPAQVVWQDNLYRDVFQIYVEVGRGSQLLEALRRPENVLVSGDHLRTFSSSYMENLPSLLEWIGQESDGKIEWLSEYIGSPDAGLSTEKLADLIGLIEGFLEHGRGRELENTFAVLDVTNVHPTVMLALLRITFPFRNSLNGWKAFLNRVDSELTNRDLDSKAVLKGLL